MAGRHRQAEQVLRAYLAAAPDDPQALDLLAQLATRLGRHGDAASLWARCVSGDPENAPLRRRYAMALHRDGCTGDALCQVGFLVQLQPGEPGHRELQAGLLSAQGRYEDACDTLRALVGDCPERVTSWLAYGHALAAVGEYEASVAAYGRAIELQPQCGEAWWSLANLKTLRFDAGQRGAMQALLANPGLAESDRAYLEFALGKACEDAAAYEESFQHYARGNDIRRARSDYDAGAMSAYVRQLRHVLTAECFRRRQGCGVADPDPIFIVGLPRSGSTLIEQILASHSQVEGTRELPDLPELAGTLAARAASGASYPGILAHLSATELATLGRVYLEKTRQRRHTAKPFFIDKAPLNFLHIGLIELILPNAKIIDVRRHPMACCLSAYTQHFSEGYRFTYSLADLGRYYRDYLEWMGHVDSVLPGRVHRIHYETLLEDPDAEIRRLLAHCGLAFEPACLQFHETPRAIATPSAFQVRQPLYRGGLQHWQHFAPWLQPLQTALGAALNA